MLAGATVKLVSNYILLAKIGVMGAPISTVLCYITAATINIVFVVKYVGELPSIFKSLLLPLICSITSIGSAMLLYYFVSINIFQNIATIISIITAIFIYLLLILRTGAVSENELVMIFGKNGLVNILKRLKFLPRKGKNI